MIVFDGPPASVDQMIDVLFGTLRHMIEQHVSSDLIFNSGVNSMNYITDIILTRIEDEQRQTQLMDKINTKFMALLLDYDKPAVWNLLVDFQSQIPAPYHN